MSKDEDSMSMIKKILITIVTLALLALGAQAIRRLGGR